MKNIFKALLIVFVGFASVYAEEATDVVSNVKTELPVKQEQAEPQENVAKSEPAQPSEEDTEKAAQELQDLLNQLEASGPQDASQPENRTE